MVAQAVGESRNWSAIVARCHRDRFDTAEYSVPLLIWRQNGMELSHRTTKVTKLRNWVVWAAWHTRRPSAAFSCSTPAPSQRGRRGREGALETPTTDFRNRGFTVTCEFSVSKEGAQAPHSAGYTQAVGRQRLTARKSAPTEVLGVYCVCSSRQYGNPG